MIESGNFLLLEFVILIRINKMSRVLIIGGGFAGCAAAHQFSLKRPHDEVVLIEKNSFCFLFVG